MANNVDDKVLSLLEDDWTSSNTNSLTPEFIKITDVDSKRYNFNRNSYVVLIHRPLYLREKNSVGKTSKRLRDTVRIDLRSLGKSTEDNFILMQQEIERILDANIQYPFGVSSYDEIDAEDQPIQDLSDRSKGLFRVIFSVKFVDYNKTRGT